jgi:hypothetical protein
MMKKWNEFVLIGKWFNNSIYSLAEVDRHILRHILKEKVWCWWQLITKKIVERGGVKNNKKITKRKEIRGKINVGDPYSHLPYWGAKNQQIVRCWREKKWKFHYRQNLRVVTVTIKRNLSFFCVLSFFLSFFSFLPSYILSFIHSYILSFILLFCWHEGI